MSDSGHVILHRKILRWEWYSDINTCRLFIHMLLKSNWREGKFRGTTVPRGSFASSLEKLSEETGLTIRELRTAISHLKMTGELTVTTTNKYSVFTVKNYDLYQCSDTQNDVQGTGEGQSNDITTTTIEKEEKRNKYNKKELESIKDTFCTEPEKSVSMPSVISLPLNDKTFHDVCRGDVENWEGLYPAVDVMQELRKMRGWLDCNPTKRKTKRGIGRFINNWLSRAQDSGGSKGMKGGDTSESGNQSRGQAADYYKRFLGLSDGNEG